jgi:hypothetical protein
MVRARAANQINGQIDISGTIAINGSISLSLEQPPAIISIVTTRLNGFSVRAQGDKMAYTLPSAMQIEVGVQYTDAAGNPATVDDAVVWNSSDETILTVSVVAGPPAGYPNGGVCVVQAVGPIGQAQITATADADLGAGTKNITTLLDVQVIAGEAVAGVIAPIGDPSPI